MIWPAAVLGFRDRVAEHDMEELQDIILAIRKLRGELKIAEIKPITILIHTPTKKLKDSLTRNAGCIRTLGNVRSLALIDDVNIQGPAATAFLGATSLILPLDGVVDVERERERLKRELEKTEQHIIKCRQKLNNVAFLEKAPESVVQSEKSRLENLESTRNKYLGFLESLS
jgi:valyl-tRNA synthetase